MATFKYIGWMTKDNGKVDTVVPKKDGTKQTFSDVEPNVTEIVVTDPKSIKCLQNSQDLDHQYNYEQIA
jgi:hypothetical protein